MIPKVTRGGSSFKGAFSYYMHDKDGDTRDRIAWTHTENMRTDDPDQAWRVMAYTANEQKRLKEASGQSRAGRKLEKPVFAYSLAWHPEQDPSREHMLETALESLQMLGLSEHEALIVAHKDEPQKHVHVIVNRVHPINGLAGDIRNSKRKFSDFAREYERRNGKIYCEQREENHRRREEGKPARYHDPVIAKAWEKAVDGRSFAAALERQGYVLAQGKKRPVIVDPHGKAHNPTRHLEGVRAKQFAQHIADLGELPDAGALQAERTKKPVRAKDLRPFEEVTSLRLEISRTQQQNERERLAMRYERHIAQEKQRLIREYKLPQQKRRIEAMADNIRNAPWWRKWFGFTRRDKQELQEHILAFKNARWRYREQLEALVNKKNEELADLRQRQENEREALKNQIERERELARQRAEGGRAGGRGWRPRSHSGAAHER